MKVLVVGASDWKDVHALWRELEPLHEEYGQKLLVIRGDCKTGVDAGVAALCKTVGIDQVVFPLNEKREDAESFRYWAAIKLLKPDRMIAFHPFIKNSTVTKAAVAAAEKEKLPILRVTK